jgi:hypothetical protein
MSVSVNLSEANEVSIIKQEIGSVSLTNTTPNAVTVSKVAVGAEGDKHYTHIQANATDQWDVTHNLGKRASVNIVDNNGYEVIARIHYMSDNRVIIEFSQPVSGKAYFN